MGWARAGGAAKTPQTETGRMTEDRPPACINHDWFPPQPRLILNNAGQLVEHPTERMQFCGACMAERTVQEERK